MNLKNAIATGLILIISFASFAPSTKAIENDSQLEKSVLTLEQKENLYQEYEKIVQKYEGVELEPMAEFKDLDFVTPGEFLKRVQERQNITFSLVNKPKNRDINLLSNDIRVEKSATFKSNGIIKSIDVAGVFTTMYSNTHKRQMFSDIKYLNSWATGAGKWYQTGYSHDLIDLGRTYDVTLSGKYSLNGLTTTHHINVEFRCDSYGNVL